MAIVTALVCLLLVAAAAHYAYTNYYDAPPPKATYHEYSPPEWESLRYRYKHHPEESLMDTDFRVTDEPKELTTLLDISLPTTFLPSTTPLPPESTSVEDKNSEIVYSVVSAMSKDIGKQKKPLIVSREYYGYKNAETQLDLGGGHPLQIQLLPHRNGITKQLSLEKTKKEEYVEMKSTTYPSKASTAYGLFQIVLMAIIILLKI